MIMVLFSRIFFCTVVICFACACGGGSPDVPGGIDPSGGPGKPDSGEVFVNCDIAEFTKSVIDETDLSETLSVNYTVDYSSNFKVVVATAYIIPNHEPTVADLEAGVYKKYEIGSLGVNESLENVKIDFTYHWTTKELLTKMTYKLATRDNRIILNDEFEKAYLLVVGDIDKFISPTELEPYQDLCISDIPLQTLE